MDQWAALSWGQRTRPTHSVCSQRPHRAFCFHGDRGVWPLGPTTEHNRTLWAGRATWWPHRGESGLRAHAAVFAAPSCCPPGWIVSAADHPADSAKLSRPSVLPSSGKTGSGELSRDVTSGPCAVPVRQSLSSLFVCKTGPQDLLVGGWGKGVRAPASAALGPFHRCSNSSICFCFALRVLLGLAPNRIANPWTKCLHGNF